MWSLKRVVKTYVWSLPEHSLQRFLTGIKTRKKEKGKKRKEKNFFFTYLYARLTQLFFLYIGTADRLTPLAGVAIAPQPAPLSSGEGFIFFLLEMFVLQFILFSYNGKGIKEKEKKRKNKKEKQKEMRKILGAKTLRAEFPTQNLYLFLYAFSFLKINIKQFFRVIFFTLGLLWATFLREGGNIFARFIFFSFFFPLLFSFFFLNCP